MKQIIIKDVRSDFEREELIRPFGFKGNYMTEIWQSASLLRSDTGTFRVGLCSQSVLWSDPEVFASYSEAAGNALMYSMTEYALQMLKGQSFTSPVNLLEDLWAEVLNYG